MATLDHARSRSRGTLDDVSIRELARLFRQPSLSKAILGMVSELDHYDGDVFLHEGDLHVGGDFSTLDEGVILLFVRGDLIVDGSYTDFDDPQSNVLVTGNMRARDVVTAGFLEVHGNLDVSGSVIGDYNDCNAWIGGDLSCTLFYPEEHFFTVGGTFRAKHVVGNAKHRVTSKVPVEGIDMDDPRLLELFDRELLRVEEGDASEVIIDGFKNFGALKERVREGRPLRT